MNFTVTGVVLSDEEYLDLISDAPLIKDNGNIHKWIHILSGSEHSQYYFYKDLVQLPQLDVQAGDKVHLAFEGMRYSARLVDWRLEE